MSVDNGIRPAIGMPKRAVTAGRLKPVLPWIHFVASSKPSTRLNVWFSLKRYTGRRSIPCLIAVRMNPRFAGKTACSWSCLVHICSFTPPGCNAIDFPFLARFSTTDLSTRRPFTSISASEMMGMRKRAGATIANHSRPCGCPRTAILDTMNMAVQAIKPCGCHTIKYRREGSRCSRPSPPSEARRTPLSSEKRFRRPEARSPSQRGPRRVPCLSACARSRRRASR
mmetsp:Transcript_98632/g.287708  ORF Transcript_98632/g.287708 Transcript_98632/m.287708 type:complete len:226 (+) Transcript_98632:321-998(+)